MSFTICCLHFFVSTCATLSVLWLADVHCPHPGLRQELSIQASGRNYLFQNIKRLAFNKRCVENVQLGPRLHYSSPPISLLSLGIYIPLSNRPIYLFRPIPSYFAQSLPSFIPPTASYSINVHYLPITRGISWLCDGIVFYVKLWMILSFISFSNEINMYSSKQFLTLIKKIRFSYWFYDF